MRYIPLTKGFIAIVDDNDFDFVTQFKWYAKAGSGRKGSQFYAHSYAAGKMHRLIMACPKGMQVDHINHNPMDNRRSNLRICTLKENLYNRRRKLKETSRFLGVYPSLKKWQARIGVDYKVIYLGTFETAEEAAKEYDNSAKFYFGEYANLNFKESHAGNI